MVVRRVLGKAFVVAVSSMLFAVTAQANLIVNGGFEDAAIENGWSYGDEAGWEGDNVEIWDNFGAIGPYEGDKHAELNAHPNDGSTFSIYQEFKTIVDQAYNLFLAYGARSSTEESFLVEVTGAEDMTMSDHEVNKWSTYEGIFIATAEKTTLRFTSIVPQSHTVGNFLDDIRVTAVPEPGSLALLGLGMIGLAVARRKTK